MMFPMFTDIVTRRQHAAWNLLVRKCMSMDDLGTGEGWLFHGTDRLTATHIVKDGFGRAWHPDPVTVYWGSANIAATFAEKAATADSPPALIAARTRDVLSSGKPGVDWNAMGTFCSGRGDPFQDWDAVQPDAGRPVVTWRDSYLSVGCLIVRGGRRVEGLKIFDISRMPLHPDAPSARASRLEGPDYVVRPHPEEALVVEIEGDPALFPNRWTESEAYRAEFFGEPMP